MGSKLQVQEHVKMQRDDNKNEKVQGEEQE